MPTVAYEIGMNATKSLHSEYESFEAAFAYFESHPNLIMIEKDEDYPGCADVFLSDGRLLSIEPKK
jgi:hypothetical protein